MNFSVALSRICTLLAVLLAAVPAHADVEPEHLALQIVHKYHNAANYKASGSMLVIDNLPNGARRVETFETFEIAFDRKHGIRASEHRHSSEGLTMDHTAWGPLDAIQSYREDRVQSFIVHVETRKPSERQDGFGEFFTGASNTPVVWVLAGLLIDGKIFPTQGETSQRSVETASAVVGR